MFDNYKGVPKYAFQDIGIGHTEDSRQTQNIDEDLLNYLKNMMDDHPDTIFILMGNLFLIF